MADERHIPRPLIVAAAAAGVVGVGWLAHGLRKGRHLPRTESEALEIFRDNTDGLYPLRARVMDELFKDEPMGMHSLYGRLLLHAGADTLARHVFDRTMTSLRDIRLGHFAMVDVVDTQYQLSDFVKDLHARNEFNPAAEVYISDNL